MKWGWGGGGGVGGEGLSRVEIKVVSQGELLNQDSNPP